MRSWIVIIMMLFTGSELHSQKRTGYNYVSRVMYMIPESSTGSTCLIANYINKNFTTEKDKARAIYVWIARNIKYNFDSIITNSINETPAQVSERVLKSRTGVCLNFVNLFTEIAAKTGIRSYVVHGYTKQNGKIDYLPHMWCVAKIDDRWSLIDPTWGSGYYFRGKYVNDMNGFYFMTRPDYMIRTHMPFDPMWQLLNYPATHRDFSRRSYKTDTTVAFFNFNDTIEAWENASEIEKARGSAARIQSAGVTNEFIAAKVRLFNADVEFLSNKLAIEKYDSAVTSYNKGIQALNRFIGYRNNQIRPLDSVNMMSILDSTQVYLNGALELIKGVYAPQQNISISILQLNNAIHNTMMALDEQRRYAFSEIHSTPHP